MRVWVCAFLLVAPALAWPAQWHHGLSYFGPAGLKYGAGFQHFDWVNPDAPKGGRLNLAATGTYDSFNALISKGRPSAGLATSGPNNFIYDRLLEQAADEPASYYARLAESVAVADDLSWIAFRIHPDARWHDGLPITANDMKFTYDVLKKHASPTIRMVLRPVIRATVVNEREIRFDIAPGPGRSRSVLIRLANLYPLPEHYWRDRDFSRTTVEAPLGSGPYRIDDFVIGRYVSFRRVEDYWGADLPVNRGRYNFDLIKYDYFSDISVQREAHKAGVVDVRIEAQAKDWAKSYDFAAVRKGLFRKELIPQKVATGLPVPFLFNLRLEKFQDVRVREALSIAHDFEWENRVLFHGFYTRAASWFTNSDLAAEGLPSPAELALLEPFRGRVPPRVFTEVYRPPQSSGIGPNRDALVRAHRLLEEAGWVLRDGVRVREDTGQPFTIEFLYGTPVLERVAMPYLHNLEKLGIVVSQRTAEASRYLARMRSFDFEATCSGAIIQSHTPGLELHSKFGSRAADTEGSANRIGLKDPVVDALVVKVVNAKTESELIAAGRALDRVLLWNFYAVPGFYAPGYRYAWWDKFERPALKGGYRTGFPDTWWFDPDKAARVEAGLARIGETPPG
ncbi:MAG: extracellular solute-binding protein [Gammaproteobacteria bacterium]|jgi:microcin C transport system substrate-binding protein